MQTDFTSIFLRTMTLDRLRYVRTICKVWRIIVAAENIYQMFVRHGRCGFFVKRNSWSHPGSAARIVTVDGLEAGTLSGTPPYFNNPKVIADIAYKGRVSRSELSSPGTYAYTEIDKPDWWPIS